MKSVGSGSNKWQLDPAKGNALSICSKLQGCGRFYAFNHYELSKGIADVRKSRLLAHIHFPTRFPTVPHWVRQSQLLQLCHKHNCREILGVY